MNICCKDVYEEVDLRKEKYENIQFSIEDNTLKYFEDEGVFHVFDKKDVEESEKKIKELKAKIEVKEKRIGIYQDKIRKIDELLENMKKVLIMDEKEQQYIDILGKNQEKE